jgi:hypothetical protein
VAHSGDEEDDKGPDLLLYKESCKLCQHERVGIRVALGSDSDLHSDSGGIDEHAVVDVDGWMPPQQWTRWPYGRVCSLMLKFALY